MLYKTTRQPIQTFHFIPNSFIFYFFFVKPYSQFETYCLTRPSASQTRPSAIYISMPAAYHTINENENSKLAILFTGIRHLAFSTIKIFIQNLQCESKSESTEWYPLRFVFVWINLVYNTRVTSIANLILCRCDLLQFK